MLLEVDLLKLSGSMVIDVGGSSLMLKFEYMLIIYIYTGREREREQKHKI